MKSKEQILKESLAADWGLPVSLVSLQMGQVSESVCYAAMQSYADQFAPKWIGVEEGLPESYVNVLVYYDDDGLYRVDTMIHNGKKWIYQWTNKFTVTHWMPLPEPPKTEK